MADREVFTSESLSISLNSVVGSVVVKPRQPTAEFLLLSDLSDRAQLKPNPQIKLERVEIPENQVALIIPLMWSSLSPEDNISPDAIAKQIQRIAEQHQLEVKDFTCHPIRPLIDDRDGFLAVAEARVPAGTPLSKTRPVLISSPDSTDLQTGEIVTIIGLVTSHTRNDKPDEEKRQPDRAEKPENQAGKAKQSRSHSKSRKETTK